MKATSHRKKASIQSAKSSTTYIEYTSRIGSHDDSRCLSNKINRCKPYSSRTAEIYYPVAKTCILFLQKAFTQREIPSLIACVETP